MCVQSYKYASWVNLTPQSDYSRQGEAEVRILDFKTTWSEFKMLIRLLLSKAKPSYVYSILKPHGHSSRSPVRVLLGEAKPSCVSLILKPHGQNSKSPFRSLPYEVKPSYISTILKHQLPKVGPKQLCALAHLGCYAKSVLPSD